MTFHERVAAPILDIKALSETGEFEGYASTFNGEPDAYGDVIAPGAFSESLKEHLQKGTMPKLFWQHDRGEPIGKWLSAEEDQKGLFVKGRLNFGVQRAKEAYALLKEGDIDGLSIGYRVLEYSVDSDTGVWTLEKLDLLEVSVVSIGANDSATVDSVKASRQTHELIERLKAGDRLQQREFETIFKGALGCSNSQAERAARLHLKRQGDPAEAERAHEFLSLLVQ
jgi:HK97 family phage prohead protease